MFYRLRQTIYRFMAGRYGTDALTKALFFGYVAIWAFNLFLNSIWLSLALLALTVYIFFRMLSRNIEKRRQENARYLRFSGKVKSRFALQGQKWRDRKTARYRTCPHCRANIKLPNKKGRHTVECPRCHKDFKVRISI